MNNAVIFRQNHFDLLRDWIAKKGECSLLDLIGQQSGLLRGMSMMALEKLNVKWSLSFKIGKRS